MLYLNYNTGRRISSNGHSLANTLEDLIQRNPKIRKKENPCLVPYSQLSEREKDYDREMAVNTIKLLLKLGYEIKKR